MTKRRITTTALLLLSATAAHAHGTVRPREAKAGATETYTMRVPTEGKVATTGRAAIGLNPRAAVGLGPSPS